MRMGAIGEEAKHRRCKETLAVIARWLVPAAVCVSLGLHANHAEAFRTGADTPDLMGTERVRWSSDVISFELYKAVPSGLALSEVSAEVVLGMQAWSAPACSAVQFDLRGVTSAHAAPGDGLNTVEWLPNGWVERGFNGDAAGITDVQYAKMPSGKWAIVEADMYLNGGNHSWILEGDGGVGHRDVRSVVTHELGHMLGLLHPCEPGGDGGAPDCATDPAFAGTTMYPFYLPTQSTLSMDDQAGVCFLYPMDDCSAVQCAAGTLCVDGACAESCGGRICGHNEVCLSDQCLSSTPLCGSTGCDAAAMLCASASDCGAGFQCVLGQCQPSVGGSPGDPCSLGAECSSQICVSDGYCAGPCALTSCTGEGCVSASVADCSSKRPLGAECQEANQCIGSECLAGAENSPVCTRACGNLQAACPLGWDCRIVDARSVCAPPGPLNVRGAGCSCSIRPDLASARPVFGLPIVAFLLLWARRRLATRAQLPRSFNGVSS
jgi:hypothetical protein